ncbi:Transmembrane protein 64 [Mortierella sp. NVP85]|nr:Transmembrane protein 64 [Mortierella sp. NVP85]
MVLGYVYGFGFGLFIAYTSAFLGSITCFYLCRRWFKSQVRDLMAKKQSMKSVVKAVEKRGFKLMLLIRLAPYPFNVINALLSATHIPLSTFAIATAISLLKLALHVYIGSTLSSLAIVPPTTTPEDDDSNGDTTDTPVDGNSHGRTVKIVVMVISMILGVVVGAYVWIVAKREIEASEGNRVERRRRKRESLRQGLTRSSTGKSRSHGRSSSATASSFGQLLARTAPSFMGGFDLSSQDRIQSIDLAGNGESSDFVGGSSVNMYLDDDEGKESQALVSSDGFHSGRRRSGSSSHAGYDTESGESDFVDDDDDDISDMERGVEDEDQFTRNSTEMSMRDLSHSLSSPRRTEPVNWFAENGVDVNERW